MTEINIDNVSNVSKTRLVIRGSATSSGRLAFYFKAKGNGALFLNKYWFTEPILENTDLDSLAAFLADSDHIHSYKTPLQPFEDDPIPMPGPAYTDGWPQYENTTTGQKTDLLFCDPIINITSDLLGEKLVIDFYTSKPRFDYIDGGVVKHGWFDVDVSVSQENGLEGFGTLMVTSDYSVYISIPGQVTTGAVPLSEDNYYSLNFLIDSSLAGVDTYVNEDLGIQAPYFRIPVYVGDTNSTVINRMKYGDNGADPLHPIACYSLSKQINDFFNRVSSATGLFYENSFTVIIENEVDKFRIKVNISTVSDHIQHQISCYAYGLPEVTVQTICNLYFIDESTFELRSFYDMYGIDKPAGNVSVSTAYKPLAYGFKFNLDYITEYNEQESSSIDVTAIPGQSSAKAIGIDSVGCIRDINISGIRVDNCNIWMFHVPWQEKGLNQGIIYTGTSNWGWVKFMKATMGTFQMTSGPYRLIMMTIPSSQQMQYFPTRDGKYQYSDGTYVMLAGWEDQCYVMIENFQYSRSEDMFNAIQYQLKLKRVAPLMAGR